MIRQFHALFRHGRDDTGQWGSFRWPTVARGWDGFPGAEGAEGLLVRTGRKKIDAKMEGRNERNWYCCKAWASSTDMDK